MKMYQGEIEFKPITIIFHARSEFEAFVEIIDAYERQENGMASASELAREISDAITNQVVRY